METGHDAPDQSRSHLIAQASDEQTCGYVADGGCLDAS